MFSARRLTLLILTAIAITLFPGVCLSGPYAESAHADPSDGVNRQGLTPPGVYGTGNCAHCHEQHSSIGGNEPSPSGGPDASLLLSDSSATSTAPYSTSSNACFQCHSSSSVQVGSITNYDYSGTFAGNTTASGSGGTSPTSIMDAFNKDHRHDLNDIHTYAQNNFAWFGSSNNACSACHNPHRVKQNRANPTDRTLAVMSMPDSPDSLFGDQPGQSIDDFSLSASYIPPLYEPLGSQTPDYNTFCLFCHENSVETSEFRSHYHGNPGEFLAIDWTTIGGDGNQTGLYIPPGDKHGVNTATGYAAVDSPYTTGDNQPADAVLSCTNCHEAHGSENDYMHRRYINGASLAVVITGVTNDRGMHCLPCHTEDAGGNQWKDTHHGGGFSNDNPYVAKKDRDNNGNNSDDCNYCHGSSSRSSPDFPIPCEDCHFHGSFVDEFDKHTVEGQSKGVKYVKPDFAPYRRKTF